MSHAVPAATVPVTIGALIGGETVLPDGPRLLVLNPATEAPLSELAEADAAMVDRAVMAARASFEGGAWSRLGATERADGLMRIHATLSRHADELAWLECTDTGIPLAQVTGRHVARAIHNFRFFAEYITQSANKAYAQDSGHLTLVTRAPVGVAALLAPWNAPLALASMKVASALAFGNSAVLKPSETTPLAVTRMVELIQEAGLPPGVLNLVHGRGPVTGEALVRHAEVDLVSFTGGTVTGRRIMVAAAERLKPATLELGGKSANIVFADSDLERALDAALLGIFSNNGQQCLAGSRILVQRPIAEEFMARFAERAARVRVGDPFDPATEVGPMVSAEHAARVLSHVHTAAADGCRLLAGGGRPQGLERGFYVSPTAVLAPGNGVRACREEIFGPFATFLVFDTAEEAFRLANDSEFGLAAYVWSESLEVAMRAQEMLRAGTVWINTPMARDLRAPFGGFKDSGVGREGGEACERFYTEERTVMIGRSRGPLPRLGTG
ncbi:MAG TPA: aldehyde dehydrogenase [Azospirillaceae bacterium]|nr:aldehyde dehydrogenase [Azospirillaceae bacterium]